MKSRIFSICKYFFILVFCTNYVHCFRQYSKKDLVRLREEVREMFQHAYNGYLTYASGYDELRPLSCDGINTWGSYSLTLIDALDTLAVMGNYTEFRRVVKVITEKSNFDADINVSVFETNIRIVGGLLSAHLLSLKAGVELEPGWPCNGPLLRLAEDVAKRLLPAFDTKTGMPYGTVNLRYGVPSGETSVTCTAGIGTFIVEFGTLSRLTGNPIYEEVALNAIYSLWNYRSSIGLFGNHIDVQTGRWTAQDAGIGAGVDSFYEYLVKGAVLLNRPELLELFHEGRKSIDKYLRKDDWHVWVSMNKGQVTLPVFQSLEAYWPGVLSLIGEIPSAMRTLRNHHKVWRQYGFLPEFYNIPNGEASVNRENYPLRPELIESVMYLYRATNDPYLLEVGEDILTSIQYSARTPCGYATIKNVRDHRKEDRMESFFLAETTKYLYLLFDEKNFIHNDGGVGTIVPKEITLKHQCVVDTGGYVFNTEAHPIDPAALDCCYDKLREEDLFEGFRYEDYLSETLRIKSLDGDDEEGEKEEEKQFYINENCKNEHDAFAEVEINKFDESNPREVAHKLALEVVKNFEKIEIEFQRSDPITRQLKQSNITTDDDLIPKILPNFINRTKQYEKEKVQQENLNEQQSQNQEQVKQEYSKEDEVQNKTDATNKTIEILSDEFKLLENDDYRKLFDTSKAIEMNKSYVFGKLTAFLTLVLEHLNENPNLIPPTDDDDDNISDFWNNLNVSTPSSKYFADFLEKSKYNRQLDVQTDVIGNLSKLQESYYKNSSKELKSEYVLNKIVEFLNYAQLISNNNGEIKKIVKLNDIIKNEIDHKIYEIMLNSQKEYEIFAKNETINMNMYSILQEFTNDSYLIKNIDKLGKMVKQADEQKLKNIKILNKKYNQNEYFILQFDIFDFLHSRVVLLLSYKKILSAMLSKVGNDKKINLSMVIDEFKNDHVRDIDELLTTKIERILKKLSKAEAKDANAIDEKQQSSSNDDIIIVDRKIKETNEDNEDPYNSEEEEILMEDEEERETGIGSVEPVNLDFSESSSSSIENEIHRHNQDELFVGETISSSSPSSQLESPNKDNENEASSSNSSILSEFVQTILKTTMPSRKEFNPDELLKRIREKGLYLNKKQNFELFYCTAPSFLSRFSLHGQYLDN